MSAAILALRNARRSATTVGDGLVPSRRAPRARIALWRQPAADKKDPSPGDAPARARGRLHGPLVVVAVASLLVSCTQRDAEEAPRERSATGDESVADATAPLTVETQEGPVTATLTLTPAEPRLGDPLVLTLDVVAKAGVAVEMPAFGEALGRFAIVDYTPREEAAEDGVRLSQRYTLQAPSSGRQRIPRLRVEFLDERDPDVDPRARELLTDELAFVIASVLPEGQPLDELRPARASLEELHGPWLARNWPWIVLALVVVSGGVAALVWWLRRAEERARQTAFDRAMARLDRLERRGLPGSDAADAWYVELSDIVRRYIEERFALRAPELTTEEFLAEAGRSAELTAAHRELLAAFLATCDRVKFARYSPGEGESQDALGDARRFLEDTATAPDEPQPTQPRTAPVPLQAARAG